MTSVGTGYDLSNSVFSPDGRNFQVEYAAKAVENGATSVGLLCEDGVVLAVEKLVASKLLVKASPQNKGSGANTKIQTVGRHIGCACSGLVPDGRHLVNRAREESQQFKQLYKRDIPPVALADRMGQYVQAHTLYNSVRPFGVAAIFGGVDPETAEPHLYMLEPSGVYWGYRGAATGKGRQSAKAELEKLISSRDDNSPITTLEAVKELARIIYIAHEDNKEKEFEVEISWCSREHTQGKHTLVQGTMLEEALEYAKSKTSNAQDDSDDSDADSDDAMQD
ncbi:proteasome core particle subunit alpha 7 KNAG_0E00230 [Huiozyma naganishii CBS 8797]|uniref:Proteasome alpha-type subunits domain-containing protein n=1 Tax=Huiozyma naganishii (strain ATCC MYA-139 / BCRC 22969 / CBS 8797 / KCTC 17520 / NBRC 10181 / NCYC 3082 / Yp74L-3) TaxID=1071383 RepID=J7S7E8_HUIN7|nr:hypothetical protein KNAG_0E00230 [Kazachstania naganishii CBS 8797]CCK70291.1 hypothetical protein KNAG_0E00230 [Kazachstania naganishii CBS 8797]